MSDAGFIVAMVFGGAVCLVRLWVWFADQGPHLCRKCRLREVPCRGHTCLRCFDCEDESDSNFPSRGAREASSQVR
jgi:hypothetical protein